MSEISPLESGSVQNVSLDFEETHLDAEINVELESPKGSSGETLQRMQDEEALHRAAMPNIKRMERQEELAKISVESDNPEVQFEALKELAASLIEDYARVGGDLRELLQLFEKSKGKALLEVLLIRMTPITSSNSFVALMELGIKEAKVESRRKVAQEKPPMETLLKERTHGALEDKLIATIEMWYFSSILQAKTDAQFQPLFLQLYEFEKEKGVTLLGSQLLETQLAFLLKYIEKHPEAPKDDLFKIVLQTMVYLEQEKATDILKTAMPIAVKLFYNDLSLPNDHAQFLVDFVFKYDSLKNIEKIYKDRELSDYPPHVQEIGWIVLHCKFAEALLSEDREKGLELLDSISKLVEERFWTYPISWNKENWDRARAFVLKKIGEIRAAHSEAE